MPGKPSFSGQLGKVARQSGVYFVGQLFAVAAGFLFKIYLANELGAKGIGLFALGAGIVAFTGSFISLGLGETSVRYVSAYLATSKYKRLSGLLWRGFFITLTASIICGLILVIFKHQVAFDIFNEPDFLDFVPFFGLFLVFESIYLLLNSFARGFQEVSKQTFIGNFIKIPVKISVGVLLIGLGYGVWGYMLAEFAAIVVVTFLMTKLVWKLIPKAIRFLPKKIPRFEKKLVDYSKSMIALKFLSLLSGKSDTILVAMFLSTEELGVYSIIMAIVVFIPTLLESVNSIFAPIISEHFSRRELSTIHQLFKTLTKWTLGFTSPLILVIVIFSESILGVFGSEFETGWLALIVFSLGHLVNVGVGSVGYILRMTDNQNLVIRTQMINSVLIFSLYFILIPKMGLMGAALAKMIGLIFSNILNLWYVNNRLSMFPYNSSYLKLILPISVTALVLTLFKMWFLTSLSGLALVVGAGAIASVVFVVSFLIMGSDQYDKIILAKLMSKVGLKS